MACLAVAWASRIAENWGLTGATDHGCRGLEVRLIAQMSVNGTPRVTSVTHTLYRFPRKRSGAAKSRHDQDVPPSTSTKELRFTQSATMRYADASGDHNPIHTSPLLARAFGFRGAIAHGMHTLARCVGVRARPVVLVLIAVQLCLPAAALHNSVLVQPSRQRCRTNSSFACTAPFTSPRCCHARPCLLPTRPPPCAAQTPLRKPLWRTAFSRQVMGGIPATACCLLCRGLLRALRSTSGAPSVHPMCTCAVV